MRLVAENLCIDRGGRRILSDVSFAHDGGALLVTGANGTGKSSLLRVLAGFLSPAAGRVCWEGGTKTDTPLAYLGHRDGLKPQLTARENLRFAAGFFGSSADGAAALERLGLVSAADVPVGWLSAGQKRRVALARLLVVPQPVWILDEPTTALDAASVRIFEQVATEHLTRGGLMIAATHAALSLPARELRLGFGE